MTDPTQSEVEAIVARLTKAQRARMHVSEVIVLRSRHDTRIALNLKRKGLAERGRHLNQFVWTPLGLAVKTHLQRAEALSELAALDADTMDKEIRHD